MWDTSERSSIWNESDPDGILSDVECVGGVVAWTEWLRRPVLERDGKLPEVEGCVAPPDFPDDFILEVDESVLGRVVW